MAVNDPKLRAMIESAMQASGLHETEAARAATIAPMSDAVPRPELDAKLDALRQEMRADSASLRGEFDKLRGDIGQWRGEMHAAFGRMEASLQATNTLLGKMDGDVKDLSSKVATFKWQVLGASVAVLLGIWATGFSIQQMTVSTFQAAGQQAQPQQPTVIVVPGAAAPAPAASR